MFFLANNNKSLICLKWSYKRLGLENDSGWQRIFIYIPLIPSKVPTKKVDLSDILTKDAGGLINWDGSSRRLARKCQ